MDAIDFNYLYYVKGTPGVWSFKKQLSNNLALLVKFGTNDVYHQAKPNDVHQLSSFPINTNEGPLTIEKVMDWLFEDSDKPDFIFDFDKQDSSTKIKLMAHYVPNCDFSTFKESHMAKIYKWFNDLYKALNKADQKSVDDFNNKFLNQEKTS